MSSKRPPASTAWQPLFERVRTEALAGRVAEAWALAKPALASFPGDGPLPLILGSLAQQAGDSAGALPLLEKGVTLMPAEAQGWSSLGAARLATGDEAGALAALEKAVALAPQDPVVTGNLALGQRRTGQLEAALATYSRALAGIDLTKRPDAINLAVEYANLLRSMARLDDAMALMQQLAAAQPGSAAALRGLGRVAGELGQLDLARQAATRALEIEPSAEAWHELGRYLKLSHLFAEAEEALKTATRLKPGLVAAWNELGDVARLSLRLAEAEAAYAEVARLEPQRFEARSNLVLLQNYRSDLSPEALFAAHLEIGRDLDAAGSAFAAARHYPPRSTPPRIGIVSPDFRRHSVAFFLAPLLAGRDKGAATFVCFSKVGRPDAITDKLRTLADEWVDVTGVPDAALAEIIASRSIDILIDADGHMAGGSLAAFARRPAPVQITWLGYPGTTGMKSMDGRITDEIADPPGAEAFHTEKLIRLPSGFLCYAPAAVAPPVAPLPAGTDGPITFGSFNTIPKLSPVTLALWSQVLAAVPGSRLLIKTLQTRSPEVRRQLLSAMAGVGIDAGRLIILDHVDDDAGHLAAYGQVDIALDPVPYNGTTTTCEALWMGVPVITLSGDRHAARVGASILSRLGLEELVAASPQDYITVARALAADRVRLADLRAGLRSRMARSPLCDARGFSRNFIESVTNFTPRP
ncbi:O-linked N-acetylglucosamine transferase, SPINDLY family protein [Radicibacter daui]|uniref:O-linked N-acetylglucosamine transferase, SPINDLY family protein n=1 Tax=Radicibacter daui TaxID=3064829 RepID=UPI0040468A76